MLTPQPCRLILASRSPRRKTLLEKLGLQFEVMESQFVETVDAQKPAQELVMDLAAGKASAVADQVMQRYGAQKAIILAGDTMVVFNDQYLGQPESKDDAIRVLSMLSGRWHEIFTGVALITLPERKIDIAHDVSKVKIRELSAAEIKSYVSTGEPLDVAGSYALQGVGAAIVERLEGCVSNVIGFPIPLIVKMLRNAGVEVLGEPSGVLSIC